MGWRRDRTSTILTHVAFRSSSLVTDEAFDSNDAANLSGEPVVRAGATNEVHQARQHYAGFGSPHELFPTVYFPENEPHRVQRDFIEEPR